MEKNRGVLYIVPTPIGNLEDMTIRGIRTLESVDLIACEDTRHTKRLLNHYKIQKELISYHEHNERSRTEEMIERLKNGDSIALVSDAGTPCISDPGAVIVERVQSENLKVVVLPGANALLPALILSGFSGGKFTFFGFLPRKTRERDAALESILDSVEAVITYESPMRLLKTLERFDELAPKRQMSVVREISKIYEESQRGTARELIDHFSQSCVKGEIVIVISGKEKEDEPEPDLEAELNSLYSSGCSNSEAVKLLAKKYGISKNKIYEASLKIKEAKN